MKLFRLGLSAAAFFSLAGASAAQQGQMDPLPLQFEATDCDARASILNIVPPIGRNSRVIQGVGFAALLDVGPEDPHRYQFLIAAQEERLAEQGFAFCKILVLTEPTLALTNEFYPTSSGNAGGTLDARTPGPGLKFSMQFQRTDMTDATYLVDAVAYVHLATETGDVTFEIWSMGPPRKINR